MYVALSIVAQQESVNILENLSGSCFSRVARKMEKFYLKEKQTLKFHRNDLFSDILETHKNREVNCVTQKDQNCHTCNAYLHVYTFVVQKKNKFVPRLPQAEHT